MAEGAILCGLVALVFGQVVLERLALSFFLAFLIAGMVILQLMHARSYVPPLPPVLLVTSSGVSVSRKEGTLVNGLISGPSGIWS